MRERERHRDEQNVCKRKRERHTQDGRLVSESERHTATRLSARDGENRKQIVLFPASSTSGDPVRRLDQSEGVLVELRDG